MPDARQYLKISFGLGVVERCSPPNNKKLLGGSKEFLTNHFLTKELHFQITEKARFCTFVVRGSGVMFCQSS